MFPEITRDDVFRLETARLWLRWPRAADGDNFMRYAGDPDVALKTGRVPYPYEKRDAESFIITARGENAAGRALILAVTRKAAPNEAIGVVGLHGGEIRGASVLGFWLGKPFWGQGVMSEAAGALVDLGFGVTALDRIVSSALPTNVASVRIHEKLGFKPKGQETHYASARLADIVVETFELRRGAVTGAFAARRPQLRTW
jgi:RimJ/RimL family protein N-acetyltransferase